MIETLRTPREVAADLKVSPATVERLRKRGELVGTRISGVWRYAPGDVAAYLARARQPVGRRQATALPRVASDFDVDAELAKQFGRAI